MRPHCVVASCARSITHTDALPRVLGGVYHCAHLDRRISRPKSERHPYDGNHMKAVVMAGGEGSRLRPLTSRTPKPLVPVAGRPIMEHILLHLRRHQMRDVVATVQYLGASIRNYFGDGSEQGIALRYSGEDSPLRTPASVMPA